MSYTYRLCRRLIENGRTDGLVEKLDVFLAVDRLTASEYQELAELLNPELVQNQSPTR